MSYNYYSKRSNGTGKLIIYIAIMIVIVIAYCYRPINKAQNIRQEIATVTDKGIKNKNKDSKYLVYCKDEDGHTAVYEVTDSMVYGRFNSSDVYAEIEIGKTYEFTVGGDRSEFWSWYPNIYECKEIDITEEE